MKKWNLIIDVERCCNCGNCSIALKDEYVGNAFAGYSAPQAQAGRPWVTIDRIVRGSEPMVDVSHVPRTCNHCDNAPCVKAGAGAVRKRDDGIVVIDPEAARGARHLVGACPYGAIVWNEEEDVAQHWNFDAHLIDAGWTEPRMVQACPTGAMESVLVEDSEMQSMVAARALEVLRPELNTKPRVYYLGLSRAQSAFVGGNVSVLMGDRFQNVDGAVVVLGLGSKSVRTTTDEFGDFRIDGLAPQGDAFQLVAEHPEFGTARVEGRLRSSVYLGSLQLTRASG